MRTASRLLPTKTLLEALCPTAKRLSLQRGEDGRMMLSPEAMKALDKEFGNKPPPQQNANSPQISEEEWRMQEALRQLEEAVR